ncbi:exosome non-catalytic core subunit MTR3 PWA37_005441 [Arxiozyma heterogenica]|uniref:exosome non-catalytic core subunit MTR3 n=1 Tax=Arxiozyma heterogenica TaxID=278026 RepID=UPI002EEEA533
MNVQDRRRILGPASAKPLVFANSNEKQSLSALNNDELNFQNGIISNSNGSSIVENNKMSLLTLVYGPRSTRDVSFQPNCKINIIIKSEKFETKNLKELSQFLISVLQCCVCLENYPKSGIDIFINFNIEDEDELVEYIPALVSGCIIALIDANIEITDIIGAITLNHTAVCLGQNGDQLLGLWKDPYKFNNNESDDYDDSIPLSEIIKSCQEKIIVSKQQLIRFISNM